MPAIVTLTMNPALDVSTSVDAVRPTDKLRCSAPRYDPGGGGINVTRAIRLLGGQALALFPSGGPTGRLLEQLLEAQQVSAAAIPIAAATRESFTVDESTSGQQFRFVLPGPELTVAEREACLAILRERLNDAEYLVVSGSLPPALAPGFFADIADRCREAGVRLILDSASATPDSLMGSSVYLMKPNVRELGLMTGRPVETAEQQVAAAKWMIDSDCAGAVLISCGAQGARLVTRREVRDFPPLEVEAVSAIGAGDSMVGATVLALSWGWDLERAVSFGMAAGAAALLTPATELIRPQDVEALWSRYGD